MSDTNGYSYVVSNYMQFGSTAVDDPANCYVLYQRGTGSSNDTLTLFNQSFTPGAQLNTAVALGSPGVFLGNPGGCQVDVMNSSIKTDYGNLEQIYLKVKLQQGGPIKAWIKPVNRAGVVGAYATSNFTLPTNDYSLGAISDISVQAGSAGQGFTLTVTPSGTFSSAVSFACTGPAGVMCSVANFPGGTSALSVTGSVTGTTAGSGKLTITATGAGVTRQATANLNVTAAPPPPVPTFTVNFPTGPIQVTSGVPVTLILA